MQIVRKDNIDYFFVILLGLIIGVFFLFQSKLLIYVFLTIILLYFFRKPYILFGLVYFFVPFDYYNYSIGGINLSLSDGIFILFIFSFTVYILITELKLRINSPNILFMLLIYLSSTLIGSLIYNDSLYLFITIGVMVLIFYFSLIILKNNKIINIILNIYLISAFIQVTIGWIEFIYYYLFGKEINVFIQYFLGIKVARIMGTHHDPNYYAIYLFLAFSLYYSRFLVTKKRINLLLLIFIFSGILLILSRTGLIGSLIITIYINFVWFLKNIISAKKIYFFVQLYFVLLIFGFIMLPYISYGPLESLMNINYNSVMYRYNTYYESVQLILQKPVFGYGTANVTDMYVHNTFLYVLLRSGLYGFIPFIYILFTSLMSINKKIVFYVKRNIDSLPNLIAISGSFYGTIIGAMVMGIEGHKMLWFILGITAAAGINKKI